jgi:hypothetical protein
MRKHLLAPALFVICLAAGFAASASAATLSAVEGSATVNIDGIPLEAAAKLNEVLPVGAAVLTADDGRALLRLADGLFVELQPGTQAIIGEVVDGGALDAAGNPLPQIRITLNSGSLVMISTQDSLAQMSLVVVTPRGTVSPVNAGQAVVLTEGAEPASSTVTFVSVSGEGIVTTTAGEPLPVGQGLAVVLSADGQTSTSTVTDLSASGTYDALVQRAAASVANLSAPSPQITSSQPQPSPTPTPRMTSTTAEPSPTPTPRPTPTPSPTVSPTPTPRPTATPSPTVSPTPTPRPTPTPSPTVSPTPTPRPTVSPTPTPRPTPTPSPTQTPA